MQRTMSTPAATAEAAAASTSVSGLNASPTCSPCSRARLTTWFRSGHASKCTVTLSAPLTMIGTAIGTVALPAVAASGSAPERRHAFAWLVRSTLVLSAATTVTLVVLTPLLMRTFFGVGFLSGVLIAQVAITAALARGVGYVLAYGLCAFNRPLAPSIAEALAVLATVVGLAVLLPSLGLVGAAITSLVAYSVSAAYMLWFAQRRLEMPLTDLLLPRQGDIGQWIRCVRRDRP